MDQSLKQRLVGAVVLIALAVILLPLIFDGQKQQINVNAYDIPDKPAFSIQSVDFQPAEEDAAAARRSIQSQIDQKQDAEPIPATMADNATVEEHIEAEKKVDIQVQAQSTEENIKLADAWVIQVGAFSSAANANALRDKLNKAGFKAYTHAVSNLYKVYVGPEIRKYRLEQQKNRLEQEFKVKTLILKYIP
ncbi:hypothetical protein FT643_09935 [Ketobacter sp. MCCC 1A13808]|uniref:SPOR domain-containing protein n=1 Tax=Ketobacter sp. MCCC 1A13808 TaxID=2602738 RepID=UPI000F194236|nr:SPOR domain-containing protein [Ketobacter sp. MCCC 1A13808]MVF12459.1 hypothetical protein [Ketobacter sp. MCCC 1A13808]RLP55730.1 MAG: hypothetical protein D6160_04855 [Ketobacter sp.]